MNRNPLATALRERDRSDPAGGGVALLGIPWDGGSSYHRGAALAPRRIREALHSPASNLCSETGIDLQASASFRDGGDLDLTGADPFAEIQRSVDATLGRGERVLALGGDHSVTLPILRAYAARLGPPTILQVDAHPDLYDEFEGDRLSHACPFARILEEGLASRLVQMGIRSWTPYLREQAARFGVEVHEARSGQRIGMAGLEGPVYLSVDLDALDPAFAPGVAHPEAGGFSTRQLIDLIQQLPGPLVGADVVELNPRLDPHGLTAGVAAKLVKELAARLLEQ